MTYKKDELVRVIDTSNRYYKRVGTVDTDQVSESWVGVTFESAVRLAPYEKASIHPTGLQRVQKAEEYRKGDRIRVTNATGRSAGKDGTVEGPGRLGRDTVNVLIDGDNNPVGFHYSALELVDPAPDQREVDQIAHRVNGSIISPSTVRVGDVIEVTTRREDKENEISLSSIATAPVTAISHQSSTGEVEYLWTHQDTMIYAIHAAGTSTIKLIKGAADPVLEALRDFRLDSIIAFDYGKEKRRSVAVKASAARWHVIGGTGPKSVHTNNLRLLIQRSNDTYDILEKGIYPKG